MSLLATDGNGWLVKRPWVYDVHNSMILHLIQFSVMTSESVSRVSLQVTAWSNAMTVDERTRQYLIPCSLQRSRPIYLYVFAFGELVAFHSGRIRQRHYYGRLRQTRLALSHPDSQSIFHLRLHTGDAHVVPRRKERYFQSGRSRFTFSPRNSITIPSRQGGINHGSARKGSAQAVS